MLFRSVGMWSRECRSLDDAVHDELAAVLDARTAGHPATSCGDLYHRVLSTPTSAAYNLAFIDIAAHSMDHLSR